MISKEKLDEMYTRLEAIERDFAVWSEEVDDISHRTADLSERIKLHNLKYNKEIA